jgi:hypothetical protein
MSQSVRQSELFAGQDWQLIYRAFSEVNLNAYDFNSIRVAMTDYIRRNYPEDFNDWIDSSEFVAIIDLLAWLGQSLAFRMDLNSRDNFLDTADRRESILRLARFLSYSPKRVYPARGLVKITELRVNEDIYDSNGRNLNGITLHWDDPSNVDWFEQWITVLNSTLIGTNPYGNPLKIIDIDNVKTHLYRIENIVPMTYPNSRMAFSLNIDSSIRNFEVCNIDINQEYGYTEFMPNPLNAFHVIYRNDGRGNSSPNTGFFMYIKQGILQKADFNITTPEENRILDININNINELDVWVQEVNQEGNVLLDGEWTKVNAVANDNITKILGSPENITYNSIDTENRKIFQVVTRENDKISLRFGDGRFSQIPLGYIRVWYRVSENQSYTVKPDNLRSVQVSIDYLNKTRQNHILTLGLSLQENITNAAPSETDTDIKRRAAQLYSTQGRMVSGEDYNSFPLVKNLAVKIKSVNRVYSGQSRFIDLNDPTGTYQNANVYTDDACLYWENSNLYEEISTSDNKSTSEIIGNVVAVMLRSIELKNFMYHHWLKGLRGSNAYNFVYGNNGFLWWDQSSNALYSNSGRFSRGLAVPTTSAEWETNKATIGNQALPSSIERFIHTGSLIKFKNFGWTTVSNVTGGGDRFKNNGEGEIRLNKVVPRGDQVLRILPSFRTQLNTTELNSIKNLFDSQKSFSLGFDFEQQIWYIIDQYLVDDQLPFSYDSRTTTNNSSWLMKCEYTTNGWRITCRGLRYVFESEKNLKFYFVNNERNLDIQTGRAERDRIVVLSSNSNPILSRARDWSANINYKITDIVKISRMPTEYSRIEQYNMSPSSHYNYYECMKDHTSDEHFQSGKVINGTWWEIWRPVYPNIDHDHNWSLERTYTYNDGYTEARRVQVSFYDYEADGQPDNPESFSSIVDNNSWVFHERYRSLDGYEYYRLRQNIKHWAEGETVPVMNPGEVAFMYKVDTDVGKFYKCLLTERGVPNIYKNSQFAPLTDQNEWQANRGRGDLHIQWKHYAATDQRIDPAIGNIIDVFVLTREYQNLMDRWRRLGANIFDTPQSPSEQSLSISFSDLGQYKMFSDQLVWRPAKFKIIFGEPAPLELRAKFKVVKLPNTTISDGEIKSQLINTINDFFSVEYWDFGETFYATELYSYVHNRMVNRISSVVIVPLKEAQSFGNLFEIRCQPDELFFPVIRVQDIEIIPANTQTNLRIR